MHTCGHCLIVSPQVSLFVTRRWTRQTSNTSSTLTLPHIFVGCVLVHVFFFFFFPLGLVCWQGACLLWLLNGYFEMNHAFEQSALSLLINSSYRHDWINDCRHMWNKPCTSVLESWAEVVCAWGERRRGHYVGELTVIFHRFSTLEPRSNHPVI